MMYTVTRLASVLTVTRISDMRIDIISTARIAVRGWKDCKYNDGDGDCTSEWVTISNDTMTVAGFYPICQEYEEGESE